MSARAGRFAFGFIAEAIKRLRQRRRRKKRLRELGIEENEMALDTGLRTSTNSAIAAVIVNVVIAVVNGIWPDFTIPPDWITYLTAGVMWLTARFSKTPVEPKAL